MARSSILGGERAPAVPDGRDSDALGPSDSSDSGSDTQGQQHADLHADSDAAGTGERGSVIDNEGVDEAGDIMPDRIETIGADSESSEPLDDEDDDATSGSLQRRVADIESDDSDETEDDPDAA